MRFVDYEGNDWKDKIVGYAVGVATNVIPSSTGLRDQYSPTDPSDYNEALRAVDETALAVGTALTSGGGGLAAIGAGAMLKGGITIVASGGTAAIEGGTVAVAGAEAVAIGTKSAAVGVMLMGNSTANKSAGYEHGKTSGKNERHGDGGRSLDKAQKRIEELKAQIKESKSRKEREKLKTKIEHIRQDVSSKKRGEEHSRRSKR